MNSRQLNDHQRDQLLAKITMIQVKYSVDKQVRSDMSFLNRVQVSVENARMNVVARGRRELEEQLANSIEPYVYNPYNLTWLPIGFMFKVAAAATIFIESILSAAWKHIHGATNRRLSSLILMPSELKFLHDSKEQRDQTVLTGALTSIPADPWILAATFDDQMKKYYADLNDVSSDVIILLPIYCYFLFLTYNLDPEAVQEPWRHGGTASRYTYDF